MKITQWIYNKVQIIRRSERNFVRGLKDLNDGLFPLRIAGIWRFDFSCSGHFFFQRSPPRYLQNIPRIFRNLIISANGYFARVISFSSSRIQSCAFCIFDGLYLLRYFHIEMALPSRKNKSTGDIEKPEMCYFTNS